MHFIVCVPLRLACIFVIHHSYQIIIIYIAIDLVKNNQNIKLMFGISIFSSPQHFIGLYLGLFNSTQKGIQQLSTLLTRTKNPPISVIYTYDLLQMKSWQEYGLDIIRFLSQLSDLSGGSSMSSSLQNVIGESSFLTQMRHNLTHKIKISDYLIEVSRKIILKQLREQYWDVNFVKLMQTYRIQNQKVCTFYEKIYGHAMTQQMLFKLSQNKRKVTAQWLEDQSSNYQFKEHFITFYEQNSEILIQELIRAVSLHKKSIAISTLVNKFCLDNKNEKLCQLLVNIFRKQNNQIFSEKLVFSSLKKVSFIHYVGLCSKILHSLPANALDELDKFWNQKQQKLTKNNPKAKIYKIFRKEYYMAQ